MKFTPFEETYYSEVHHFNNGDIVTDIACRKHFVAHVNDDCRELTMIRNIFKGLRMDANRFFVEAVFTETNENDCFTDSIIVQVGYGMNGGIPVGCTHDAKWAWYVEQIAGILRHLCDAGFGSPSLRFVNDPCRNDVYTCWIDCRNRSDDKVDENAKLLSKFQDAGLEAYYAKCIGCGTESADFTDSEDNDKITARYVQRGESISYSPDHDLKAGDVVMLSDGSVGVAKLGIRAFEEGQLSLTGVYEFETDDIENWYTLPLMSNAYILKDNKTAVPYSSFSTKIGRFFGVVGKIGNDGRGIVKVKIN